MLKELIDELIIFLKQNIPAFENRVERYKNQLDKESGFTYPNASAVCFIEMLEALPVSKDAAKQTMNKLYNFRVIVAARADKSAEVISEQVFDELDTSTTVISGRRFDLVCERIFLVGWYGTMAVYEVQFYAE